MNAGGSSPALSGIRRYVAADLPAMLEIINDAAIAYKGVIAVSRWHEPCLGLI